MANQLGVFAKYWQPGAVKTRLAATVGDLAASRLYRASLQTTLNRFGRVGDRRVLAFAPAERRADFAEIADGNWSLIEQQGADLGERMRRYFSASRDSDDRVVLIGSDSPTLPQSYLEEAFQILREVPVVLGPTADGGYYLLGMRGVLPEIFSNIAWSTGEVYRQTTAELRGQGIQFGELPGWYDVDERSDLDRLRSDLSSVADQGTAGEYVDLLRELDQLGERES